MIEPDILLQGYRLGVFPMAMEDGSIEWFSPTRRGVIPLENFRLPHTARRAWLRGAFEIRIDSAFSEVIRACARRVETWINEEIIASYEELHRRGHAHSVEAWRDGKLAGGLYGVAIAGGFFGESMFHRVTDASKVALAGLVERLKERKFVLLDTQWLTPHLKQFGAIEIPRAKYLEILERALNLRRSFS
jgi:leucyl/phenylalanyl-tRNA--protein transferase